MRFARIVFIVAGIWGIVVLMPLYWLLDVTGRRYGPPVDYPQFFYGFVSRISASDAQAAVPDLLLGILFAVAFVESRASERRAN